MKKNKITIDLSEFNFNDMYCELVYKLPNVTVQFPRVYINNYERTKEMHTDHIRDVQGSLIKEVSSDLINEISGSYKITPLIDDDGVQYREIREVRG
jgi:hypothetical protein